MTLYQRVLVLALPLLIVSTGLSGWIGVGWAQKASSDRFNLLMSEFVETRVEALDKAVADLYKHVQLLTVDAELLDAVADIATGSPGTVAASARQKLARDISVSSHIGAIGVYSVDGDYLLSEGPFATIPELEFAQAKLSLNNSTPASLFVRDLKGKTHLSVVHPLRNNAGIVGIVFAQLEAERLDALLNAAHNGLHSSQLYWLRENHGGEVEIVNATGAHQSAALTDELIKSPLGALVGDALAGKQSHLPDVHDHRDISVMAYTGRSALTGLAVLSKLDRSEIFSTIDKFRSYTLLSTLITLILSTVALAIVMRGITRPLKSLTEEAQKFAGLEEDLSPHAAERDEIVVLQDVFHRLQKRIGDKQRALESMVAERTANLESANDQLVNLNQHLIDAQQRATESESRLQLAVHGSLAGIWEWRRDNSKLWMSRRCSELLQYPAQTEEHCDIGSFFASLDAANSDFAHRLIATLRTGNTFQGEVQLRCGDRGLRWFKIGAAAINSHTGEIARVAGSITDIEELKQAEQEVQQLVSALEERARTDSLTGLANRRYMNEALTEEISRARRYHHELCCIVVDADLFKAINDTHGHLTGDDVLVGLAQCIRNACRPTDFACRFGGEEFVVLLPETDIAGASAFAERIRTDVAAMQIRNRHGEVVPLTVSIGIAQWRNDEHGEELIRRADIAVYQAKARGRNRIYRWPPEIVGRSTRSAAAAGAIDA